MKKKPSKYYVPHHSSLPIIGSVLLVGLAWSLIALIHAPKTLVLYGLSALMLLTVGAFMGAWFYQVTLESSSGYYSEQMDRTFRWSMMWFLISEVFFFAALLGALGYVRLVSVPLLGGDWGYHTFTQHYLYPHFSSQWPLLVNPNPNIFAGSLGAVGPWGLPLYNTVILVMSSWTLTRAHHALQDYRKRTTLFWLLLTVVLAWSFLALQYAEYAHAGEDLKLTLGSGIYGSLFYFITGFHGLHVLIGSLFIFVMFFRVMRGHFAQGESFFAFDAATWYWHFVDVVWWFVFVCVYLI